MKRLFLATLLLAAPAIAQPTWTIYRPTNTGIPGDYVQAIYIDEQDRPHIAAYLPFWEEGGMGIRDAQDHNKWTAISNVDYPVITSPRFNDIERSPDGILWIASDGGLLKFNPATGPTTMVRYDRGNSPMPGTQVIDIAVEPGPAGSNPAVWLAIWDVSIGTGGLARFDPAANSWQVWAHPNPNAFGYKTRVAIIPDASGPGFSVWFSPYNQGSGMGMYRNGVISVAPSSGGISPNRFASNRPVDNLGNAWIYTNQGLARRAPDNTYTIVGHPEGLTTEVSVTFALRNGRAVLGTYYSDVFVWDGAWSWLGAWGDEHTYCFAEDSVGRIWAGGIGGAAVYDDGHWQRHRVTNQSMLGAWPNAIDFAPDGRVFINGNAGPGVGGFNIFDGVHWIGCNNFNYGIGPAWGLPTDDVAALAFRANGHLALGLNGPQGLVDWDGTSFNYLIPFGFDVINVEEDTLGRLWAGMYYDGGVRLVDAGGQVTLFTPGNSQLPLGENTSITVDRANPGWVWLCQPAGIAHTNGTQWQVLPREQLGLMQFSLGYFLSGMDIAPDGTWWIGSGRGLYHYFPTTGQYAVYTKLNANLPSDEIDHVRVAPDGSVWISMFDSTWPYPGGVSHLKDGTWTHYSQGSSPLPHNQIWVLETRAITGGYEMWVGTASMGIAVIKVPTQCYANCDGSSGSPVLTANDFQCFLNKFAAGDPYANCDGSTVTPVLTANDFQCFLNRFAAGCS
jgi:hypothetical protein